MKKIVYAIPLLLILSSCALIPCTSTVAPEISGEVIDAENNQPISGVTVEFTRGKYKDSSKTDEKGMFCIGPLRQWHYLIYIGSPGLLPFPDGLKYSCMPAIIKVSAPGYQIIKSNLQVDVFVADEDTVKRIEKDYDFKIGDKIVIEMKKK